MGASNEDMKSFESQWADAFEGAEMTPSDQLWVNLDGALANQEVNKFRRGVFFYRLLAAASIIVAIGLAALLFFQENTTVKEVHTAQSEAQTNDEPVEPKVDGNKPTTTNLAETPTATTPDEPSESEITIDDDAEKPSGTGTGTGIDNNSGLIAGDTNDETTNQEPVLIAFSNEPTQQPIAVFELEFIDIKSKQGNRNVSPETTATESNTDIHMYNVPIPYVEKPQFKADQLWAGLGVSSGNFDPNVGPGNSVAESADAAAEFQTDDVRFPLAAQLGNNRERYESGFSYAIAANAGWRFARRWTLQGGLQYQVSRSGLNSNTLIENLVTEEKFVPTGLDQSNAVFSNDEFQLVNQEVNLVNNFRFISLPVKVGYLILDRKLQLGINTGLSTDLFLKNKVNESNDLIESFEVSPGNESPYRRTFVSGLVSVELGYNFLNNYYLTLEPNYRRSLNSFTKGSTNVDSNPSRLGVTVGFKYLFR